ncbi:chymotrypsin-like protease CTRL-1 [Anopheles maculipalpis]|uniref:chymotrypsin-like protease CTRL-1 n=1 Tax=Anopheles maculipalpis TaxID=1496333 RepID=UPI002158D749|nr:chymotrypsin-like protease CTRL-1 [Anopheles maculipalpis]
MVSVSVRLVIGLTILQTAAPQCEKDRAKINVRECGVRNTSTGWPFHVGLYRRENNESFYFCGGTIVTTRHVIGSAHCVKPYGSEVISVRYGVTDLTHQDAANYCRVDSLIIHPNYRAPDFNDDIALLKLQDAIPFGTLARPICLWPEETAQDGEEDLEGTPGTSVGWGIGVHNVYTSVLQSAITVVQRRSRCMEIFASKLFEHNEFFCAVTPVCSGSGGSGFYVERENRFYLRGMTTFGIAPKGYYQCGVNTMTGLLNVAKYTGWIRQVTDKFELRHSSPKTSEISDGESENRNQNPDPTTT